MSEQEANLAEKPYDARQAYFDFVDQVNGTDVAWGLANEEGWASCESEDFEGRQVLLFWSNEKNAALLCVDEWQDYEPKPIHFDDFVDDWLHGMHEDEVLVGVNWSPELEGAEIEPLTLMDDLLDDDE